MTDLDPILRALALRAEPLGPHDARNQNSAYVYLSRGEYHGPADDSAVVTWEQIAELVAEVRALAEAIEGAFLEGYTEGENARQSGLNLQDAWDGSRASAWLEDHKWEG